MSRLKDLFKKTSYIPIGRETGGFGKGIQGKKKAPPYRTDCLSSARNAGRWFIRRM